MASLLDRVDSPQDLKGIPPGDLPALCAEIRSLILGTVLQTGGHLATNLGSVELITALHYVYDAPRDHLVFDVGHQVYAHKILTGRKSRIATLRQEGGLSGFSNREESPYDLFTTGHAGTALSTALGLACGEKVRGGTARTVAVIGDAGIGAGMAFEALNMAGEVKRDLLVVLNDNRMSIAPSNGAMVGYFTRLRTNPSYRKAKHDVAEAVERIFGGKAREAAEHWYHTLRYAVVPGHLFEELGFHYFGPVDGHDVQTLVRELRDLRDVGGPRLLHVVTEKGHGYEPARQDPVKFHGVKPSPKKPAPAPDVKVPPAAAPQVSWTRASQNEDGFEVHRRVPGGTSFLLSVLPAGTTTMEDAGLLPARTYGYTVHAWNEVGSGASAETWGTTAGTFTPAVVKGTLAASAAAGKDRVKIDGTLEGAGALSPVVEGMTIRLGGEAAPFFTLTVPAASNSWRAKAGRLTWKSAAGTKPKVKLDLDPARGTFRLSVASADFAAAPAAALECWIACGLDAGRSLETWQESKPGSGKFRFPAKGM
ncbi:MAG: hypothetical protein HUU06_03045 [Planctomycetaceae bacterium]|nr:hypothetical protein [Planctomycetaceae bacterium]